MNNVEQVREFLTTRRGRLSPQQAGIPVSGQRRVSGLRRSEVATLADVSVEYYTRIERGNLSGVSDPVLEALSSALQLDEAEREHLFDLAREANRGSSPVRRRTTTSRWTPRPALQQTLDAMSGPAFVRNGRMDVVASNALARAFYDELFEAPGHGNLSRYHFLDPRSRSFFVDWETTSHMSAAILRAEAGRDPHDKQLQELVGELSTLSEEFRTRWATHNVRRHGSGVKHFHHHEVGDVSLSYETLELTAEPGLTMTMYTAEPGTPHAERLALLASWALPESRARDVIDDHDRADDVATEQAGS